MEYVTKAKGPAWSIGPLVTTSSHPSFSETTASAAVTNVSYQLEHINCHSPYTSMGRQHPESLNTNIFDSFAKPILIVYSLNTKGLIEVLFC